MPKAPGGEPGGRSPPPDEGIWTAQLDRCSIKQKRKNDQTVVPPGGGTVEDNGHPDQSIWGESSLHQTRGVPAPRPRPAAGSTPPPATGASPPARSPQRTGGSWPATPPGPAHRAASGESSTSAPRP